MPPFKAIVALSAIIASTQVVYPDAGVGFSPVAPEESGIVFTNYVPQSRYLTNQIPLNGSGTALGDIDGDGRPDVFLAGYGGANALFRNLGGWKFAPATDEAFGKGALAALEGTGAVLADIDGDGDLDLILNTYGQGTRLFTNDSRGRFSAVAPINTGRSGTSLALADVDGDGDLDLYIANYRGVTVRDDPGARYQIRDENGRQRVVAYNGRPTSDPELVGRFSMTPSGPQENGEPDALFLNDGRGGFSAVSWTEGAFLDEQGRPLSSAPYDWGLSVMFRDVTGDGRPDLYVCNDFQSEDRFWINDTPPGGPVRFRAAPRLVLRHTSAFSMGVDAADINRDGIDDFVVMDMLSRLHRRRNTQLDGVPPGFYQPGVFDDRPQFSHNTLFLGRGDGTYSEIGRFAGVSASEWSWTPLFLDVDLDGYEDLLISNGHEMDMLDSDVAARVEAMKSARRMGQGELLEMRKLFRRFDSPNAAFRNRGDLTFQDVSAAWGFDAPGVEHGMAAADLDGDGDLDLVLNTFNGPAKVLRNNATAPRLAIRLKGNAPNTRGIGARIRVTAGGLPVQTQEMISGGRYVSGDEAIRTFALGSAATAMVEVAWRDGRVTRIAGAAAGTLTVAEENTVPAPAAASKPAILFEDVSSRVGHHHHDLAFDEFARQPLIPRDLSQGGPGVTWADINGDGHDDLLIATGQGGTVGAYTNDAAGGFKSFASAAFAKPSARDLTTLLFQNGAVIGGVSNYEDGRTNGGVLRIMDPAGGSSGEVLGGRASPVGPLAAADVDGDGTLEIFAGVRAVPGRYPEPATSFLIKNQSGRLAIGLRLERLGLVNGAVFTDVDDDARPDLVVACEWGPIRVFKSGDGTLKEWNPPLVGAGLPPGVTNLAGWTGWWQGVSAGDFDGDGRMDIVAGNWGRNHFPGAAPAAGPLRVRHGDFNGDGIYDLVETYADAGGVEWPVRKMPALAGLLPDLPARFPTHDTFGGATLADLFGDSLKARPMAAAVNFESGVFLNRGDHLEWRALPAAAQFSPAFGLVVADFDGNGTEDLFVAQNFFDIHRDDARQDAGRGLLLRGDGHGAFETDMRSGIVAWGEQRGAAAADFDGDGRTDLAIGQNLGPTKLYRNVAANPGLRVRLRGPVHNPDGIGASVRWLTPFGAGPRREIRAGGGFWSVDSPATVLATGGAAGLVEVRWPDGTRQKLNVNAGTGSVTISENRAQ